MIFVKLTFPGFGCLHLLNVKIGLLAKSRVQQSVEYHIVMKFEEIGMLDVIRSRFVIDSKKFIVRISP